MSNFEKKEQNLNQLIDKLNSLSLSYSQPNFEIEKIERFFEDRWGNYYVHHKWSQNCTCFAIFLKTSIL